MPLRFSVPRLTAFFITLAAVGAAASAAAESSDGPPSLKRPPERDGRSVRLAAVGDIMLGAAGLVPENAGLFEELKAFLSDRQVVFGNLEGPLTDRGSPTKDPAAGAYHLFRSPPEVGRRLKEAGFNLLSLANNHVNDYGPEGREQTVSILDELGIAHAGGVGETAEIKAGKIRVVLIALAPNAAGCQDLNDIPAAEALVRTEAGKKGTLVVVSFHGGGEGSAFMRRVAPGHEYYLGENRGDLPAVAHAMIEAGAALVLGHGPHVPRGLEVYKGRLIAWSLGNFATLEGMSLKGPAALAPLLLADLGEDGSLRALKIVSFRQESRRGPKLDPEGGAARVMAELSDLPEEWRAAIAPPGPGAGTGIPDCVIPAFQQFLKRPRAVEYRSLY